METATALGEMGVGGGVGISVCVLGFVIVMQASGVDGYGWLVGLG